MLRRFSFLIRESSKKASWAVWALYGQLPGDVGMPELGGASGCLTKGSFQKTRNPGCELFQLG